MDDGNPCTADSCDSAIGVKHTPIAAGTACSDGNACNGAEICNGIGACAAGTAPAVNDGNPCTAHSCDPVEGIRHLPVAAGTSCSDGDACNGNEACDGATTCQSGTPAVVDDGNPCTLDSCVAATGVKHTPIAQGTACSDGNACNGSELCNASGACIAGTAPVVDDGNPCTLDSCDASTGVQHGPVASGTSCADANACNGTEVCQQGSCAAGTPVAVDDGNPCTADSCSPATGVQHVPVSQGTACPDGNACNGSEQCNGSGACVVGPAPVVDDGNPCTTDACDATNGISHSPVSPGVSCDDSNTCNGQEVCNAIGFCSAGTPIPADDGNPCTADTCDTQGVVKHTPLAAGSSCADSDVCNGIETCSAAGVCQPGVAIAVDDGNPCTIDSCSPGIGIVHAPAATGTSCSNGSACDGVERCNATGACRPGVPVVTDDGNPCTTDTCDPGTGAVTHFSAPSGTSCADSNICNGQEICDGAGACQTGAAPTLSDGNPCTLDTCNAATGQISHAPLSQGSGCDDSTLCNGHETCNDQGNCVPGAPAPVDDGQPCTVDSCDPVAGVRHVPASAGVSCDDQTVCNGRELCNGSGSCLPGAPLSLDDHDPCTNDVCDAALGVSHPAAASGTSCSDGNACNGDERCNGGGQCAAGAAPVLDDGNRCTTDSCDSATGAVRHDPLPGGSSCANASLCDGAETCNGSGVCQPGVALIVDDGNACTADSCDPSIGVKHVLNPSGSCVAPGRWDTLIASQPSPRDGAAGTFTSAGELFLFGGENAGTSLADTWLWSAAQNGWRRGTNGPSARVGAGVAFDSQRQRIIVVGGVGGADAGASYFGDTWEYSAATDSWLARPATTLPPSRAMAAFAYDSSKQRGLLFGGVGATHLADTWEWDASSGVWTQVSGQGPSARFGAAFAFDPAHGVFVLFGGSPQGVTGGALNDTWTFNSTTGLWSQRSPATKPPARAGASMTFDASASRLVMIGGTSVDALNLADAWDFDASANTWVQLSAPSTPAQTGAVAGFDPVTGQVLAATGLDYSDSGRFTGDAVAIWAYSRTTQGWLARSATTAPARLDLGAAFNSNTGRVVMRSTVNVSDASTRPMMWDYDGASRKWQATDASATETDFGSGAFKEDPFVTNFLVYDSDRKLTLRLAADATTSAGFGWIRVAEWNGEQWRAGCNVSATDATDVGASKGTAIYDPPRKRVLVFGSGRIMALNPATCAVSLITVPGPAAKDFVSIGWDADRDVFVMFGGAQLLEPQSDTWEFNPLSNTWSAVPALGPSGRSGGSMAYDSVRKKLVLYGGGVYNSAAKRDTWEYSVGTHAWSLLSTGGGPANGRAWIVFDSLRKQSLLMGTDGSVWSWDGAIWNQEVNSAAPSARSGMSGGWVPSLGAGLFFGGTSGDGRRAFLNDLWLWNGGWRQVSPPGGNASPSLWGATWQPRFGVNSVAAVGPTARTGHVLATGSSAGSVLFGGESDNGLLSDTWLLDDTSLEWSLQRSSPSPSPRTGHSMAVSTNGYVLFGGLAHPNGGTDTLVNDTWFWSPGVWSQMNLSGSPPSARYGQAMATDDASKIVILFGGRDASGVLADTWMLNLNTLQSTGWQKLTPANSPLPRFGHAMSFDSARGRIVLTGGAGALPSQSFGDTWEWDAPNTTWVKRNVTLFDARAGHTEFFDQNLQQTLQFGGFAYDATGQSARTHGDTLAFSGAAQIDPPFTHPNGDKCSAGSTCTSGVCVDGVCCNTACNSQCAACDVAGFQGTCIATSGAPHGARPSCGGSGGPCDSACNGTDMTACHSAPTGTSCGPAPGCNGGYLVQAPGACNGTGTCTQTMTSCLPYACNPTNPGFECLRNCSMDSQCFSSDYRCSASDSYGTCFERDKILSLNVSPAAPKVGVPLTITVQGSRAGSKYFFRFLNAAQISFQYPCTDSYVASSTNTMTCSFTPAAADVGTGRVDVYSMAPGSFLGQDDIKSVQFSIGAAQ